MTQRDTIAITSFLPYIKPELPACPSLMINQTLTSVLIDFCKDTNYWQEELDPITLIPEVSEIELPIPETTAIVELLRIRYKNQKELVAQSVDWLDREDPSWRTKNGGVGDYFVHTGRNTIRLVGHASQVEVSAITGRIALKPTRTATEVYDLLFEDYCEAISAGTKAMLMLMPAKEWSNPDRGLLLADMYASSKAEALQLSKTGYAKRVRRRSRAYF